MRRNVEPRRHGYTVFFMCEGIYMSDIAKRTAYGALILLLMPVIVWASLWLWEPGSDPTVLRAFYWVTETVSSPWGMVTNALLCAWFVGCLRFRLKSAMVLVIMLSVTVVIGQGIKTVIKSEVKAPRPYVLWLDSTHQIDEKNFYALSTKERGEWVKKKLDNNTLIPHWLNKSWQDDVDYSFPSGHAMFAASWALLGVGLLWPRRRYKTVAVLMVWAVAVMGSRLLLGMHWPRDLIASVGISWLLAMLFCMLIQRIDGSLSTSMAKQHEMDERKDDAAK